MRRLVHESNSSLRRPYFRASIHHAMTKSLLCLGMFFLLAMPCMAQTWSAVGDGVHGRVAAMAEYNGELYVSGQGFFSTGDQIGIVKWDGTAFQALPGSGMFGSHRIEAMAVHDGYLFVGGAFQSASGAFGSISQNVARWDGSMWSIAGNGFNNVVYSFGHYNGALYAGGDFQTSGATVCPRIAKWDGVQWTSINTVFANGGRVSAIKEYDDDLYIAGNFWAWNTWCVARWDGAAWSTLGGSGIEAGLYAIEIHNGELAVGGVNYFEAGGTPVNGMASWDGDSWASLESYGGSPEQLVLALASYQGELYAGGDFSTMGGNALKGIARYDGTGWYAAGSGVDSTGVIVDTLIFGFGDTLFIEAPHRVYAMLEYQGDLYVGGDFNMIGGIEAHDIAKWNLPLGVFEGAEASIVRLSPNPASDALTVATPSDSVISGVRVFDSTGRLVLQMNKERYDPMDISDLIPGMYQIAVCIGDRWVQKSLSVIR